MTLFESIANNAIICYTRNMKKIMMVILLILALSGCGSNDSKKDIGEDSISEQNTSGAIINNNNNSNNSIISSEFDWRLDKIQSNTTKVTAKTIDVDAFFTTKESIKKWQKEGRTVIAYISVATYESLRPDADEFPASIIGNIYPGFSNENFVDIREIDILKPIIRKRFDMIKEKGFDGIEPDNMDSYVRDVYGSGDGTGFSLTIEDGKKYIDFIIKEAKDRNLSIGQKNAYELADDYVDRFDWALTEGIFHEGAQDRMRVYVENNKTVFATEYMDNMTKEHFLTNVCPKAEQIGYVAILKDRNLTEYIVNCPKN